jgi:hypothetical protein
VVEDGDNGVNVAGVKGPGGVVACAIPVLAESSDVVLAAVVGGEPELVEDLCSAGVGLCEPGEYGGLLVLRRE